MAARWCITFLVVTLVRSYEILDAQYNEMPRLFELDDYDECFSRRGGAFCLGTFQLLQHDNHQLMQLIRNFSEDKYHFNHTLIHRGVCLSRCGPSEAPLQERFERCIDNVTIAQYGLQTNLSQLQYCTSVKGNRRVDGLDMAFAGICLVLVLMNMAGTAYDVFRDRENKKPNKFLIPWSVRANWRRLTADHSDGEPRLAALKPVQGMKALTLILIMLAHTVLTYHITYIQHPMMFEKTGHHPMSAYFQNGTSIVHNFIMISTFLLAYNLLLHAETSKRSLGLALLPKCLLHRIIRISPVYVFVLGFTVTWLSHASTGPLWDPLVEAECSNCRDKWWTHLLFVNNLVRPEVKCLIHTWFLAVDMQLYIVSAILTLLLGSRPRLALKVLPTLFCLAVLGNFGAAYYFDLKPMVTLMFPEYMRTQFENVPSFTWLYQAPWDSLPSALVGLYLAFLHYHLQGLSYKPADSLTIRILYRVCVPVMFLWVLGGYFMKGVTEPISLSLYAALDRPMFVSLTAFAMYGFFHKIDSLWWRFLCWRGWEILGRMSLSIYLVHWLLSLSHLAMRSYLSPVTMQEIMGSFLWNVVTSYLYALPLHLFIELPMQRFLQGLF